MPKAATALLTFPIATPPGPAQLVEAAPGIFWLRLPLPFARLDHVNVYLIEDGEGWAVVDTGIGDAATQSTWEALLAGQLAGRSLTRLIITHSHPDHVGAAGWLSRRLGLCIHISQTEYLFAENVRLNPCQANRRFDPLGELKI